MTTINEEKIQMNRSISDLETFQIKDIPQCPSCICVGLGGAA